MLVESGHRCALPTCRSIIVEVHHIEPWEKCKNHKYENLIALCPNCHTRAHLGDIDRKSLLLYKANLRFSHGRFSQLEVDVLFECSKMRSNKIPWSPFNMLLIKRLIDSGYIEYEITRNEARINGVKSSADYVSISKNGIDYIESLGEVEL